MITSNGKEIKLDGTSNVELLRENGTVILQDSLGIFTLKYWIVCLILSLRSFIKHSGQPKADNHVFILPMVVLWF
ncbi:hypothetical protein KUH03_29275 [Sphingobacterium sp. E70]|uniref:hypothetical protein n=1 Tax=Sphingobacterium sp. E70 TaxID=2853439 RepID=UPI00211C4F9F|nr:hypothetical protein [Sphingobacterium sp. E70]ULT23273.1 hypothetical protein KUH03_29275 [Sphingobacterium sp. E70]